jgi:phosphoribosylanthranilate isomerase
MFRVKICGLTRPQDVRFAVKAGADAIGFQMTMGPRKITPVLAKKLVKLVPPLVTPVGVFVDEPLSKVKRLIKLCGFQAVQLHGHETASYCEKLEVPVIKAIRMKNPATYKAFKGFRVAAFLLDSYNKNVPGGTGKVYPWTWARKAAQQLPAPVLISGGLNPENVTRAIRSSQAFGVDVASGVENKLSPRSQRRGAANLGPRLEAPVRPGLKDPRKVSLFIQRAKKAFHD